MTIQDHDIEQLFQSTETPPLRAGLKQEILSTASEATQPIIPFAVRWAIAALFLAAFGIQVFAGHYEDSLADSSSVAPTPARFSPEQQLASEYGLCRMLPVADAGDSPEIYREKRTMIQELIEDNRHEI